MKTTAGASHSEDMNLDLVPDPDRDFLLGESDAARQVVWYARYGREGHRLAIAIMRCAVDLAATSSIVFAIRQLPIEEQDDLMARAAVSAGWQGQFIDMHRLLVDRSVPSNETALVDLAREIGLDIELFVTDLGSARTDHRLQADRASLASRGLEHDTPLFIDGDAYTGPLDETSIAEAFDKPIGFRIRVAGEAFLNWAAAAGLVLVVSTALALLAANIGFFEQYEQLRQTAIGLSWNDAAFILPLQVWINDGLMTFFFLLIGIEIKREIVYGELSDPSRAALPLLAALGGMIVPACIYAGFNWGQPSISGWGVPMATDIAFTLAVLAIMGDRIPPTLKVFVSALAIADDLGAILVIAVFYTDEILISGLVWAAAIMITMFSLARIRVYALWPYLLLALPLWAAVHHAGLHATLAGVITAVMIPSRKAANPKGVATQASAIVRKESRQQDTDARNVNLSQHSLEILDRAMARLREPGAQLQKALETWTNFLILPLFAFFNTGILIAGSGFDLTASVSLGVMLGLVIGKPLGIFGICWLAVHSGIARLSSDISWGQLLGGGCLAGIGFTMSIFISTSAFSGTELPSVKLSILIASVASAVLGVILLMRHSRRSAATPD